MEYDNYINKEVKSALLSKGLSEEQIKAHIDEEIQRGKEFGFDTDEAMTSFLNNRLNAKFSGLLNSSSIVWNAVVLGLGQAQDDNERMRRMSKLKAGSVYTKPNSNEKITVEEGRFPWGINIGEPIPDAPNWQQEVVLGVETKDSIVIKTGNLQGPWVKDANELVPGDKISFNGSNNLINNKIVTVTKCHNDGNISDDKLKEIINTYMKQYITNIKKLSEAKTADIAVVKGNIAEYNPGAHGVSVKFTDNSVQFNDEISLMSTYLENPNFVDGAVDVIFLGNVYYNVNREELAMKTYLTIVPEMYKPKETSNESDDVIEEQASDLDEPTEEQYAKDISENISEDVEDLL